MNPITWAILVAGGTGQRYGTPTSKLLEPLAGKPVLQYSVDTLIALNAIAGIIVVTHPDWEKDYQEALALEVGSKPLLWVHGGETRRASVWQGLQALPQEVGIVLIHDAARPLVKPKYIQAALIPVLNKKAMGTSLGVPVPHTLKQVQKGDTAWVETTLKRDRIWQVHTPQVFQREVLMTAHQKVSQTLPINDDAELVERAYPEEPAVLMILDNPLNLKITTPADLQLAEALLAATAKQTAQR
jgi:2-C-methyl-D-erythritol 4-phosphate cytidylyltransferase